MPILKIETSQTGEVGVLPSYASILTDDTEAAVLTAGYLNNAVQNGASFALPCIAKVSTKESSTADYKVGWYQVTHVGANWSVVPAGSPGDVSLPTIANHVAVFNNTTGGLSDGGFVVKANTTAAYAGGGTSNAFVATGLTATSIVTAVILASTNAVSIAKAVPSANTLTVTFSADPGAATTVSWIAITPAV